MGVEVATSSGHKVLEKTGTTAAEDAFVREVCEVGLDPVASEEFGNGHGILAIPVPVSFILEQSPGQAC